MQDDPLEGVIVSATPYKSLAWQRNGLVVLDREAIDESGFTMVSDLLNYLPQQPYLRPDGFSSTGARYAELRGLGIDTTMVLIIWTPRVRERCQLRRQCASI